MGRILKYGLQWASTQILVMPVKHQILTAQLQDGMVYLWAEVDTNEQLAKTVIETFYTGENVGDGLKYIATIQHDGLVYHFYERG